MDVFHEPFQNQRTKLEVNISEAEATASSSSGSWASLQSHHQLNTVSKYQATTVSSVYQLQITITLDKYISDLFSFNML